MTQGSFIFGGNTGVTQSDLQRRRDLVRSIMDQATSGQARDLPTAIGAVANAAIGRFGQKRLDRDIETKRSEANELFGSIFAPQGSTPLPSTPGATPETSTGSPGSFREALKMAESGGRSDIRNDEGFVGFYQVGEDRLSDFNKANGSSFTLDQMQASPELQERVYTWHEADIDKFIEDNGFSNVTINGQPIDQNGLRAVAHLGGKGGLRKFVTTGGAYNPSDSNGTSLMEYATRFSGLSPAQAAIETQTAQPVQVATTQGISPALIEAMGNPFLNDQQRALVGAMFQQQLASQQPKSEEELLRLEKLRLENESLRNPKPDDPKTIKGADGFQYFLTGPKAGERVLPGVEAEEEDFKTIRGADGYNYYLTGPNAGKRVLPDVEKDQEDGITIGEDGRLVVKGSKGDTEADKKFADEFQRLSTGGLADMAKNLAQLQSVRQSLESGENLTGPVVGNLPDTLSLLLPKGLGGSSQRVETREAVEEVVQRNLREILGAQFTAKEGERLISRAYNPLADEKDNAARLDRLIRQMEIAYQSKIEAVNYFRENGTLKGFAGRLPTMDDFHRSIDDTTDEEVDDLLKKYGAK